MLQAFTEDAINAIKGDVAASAVEETGIFYKIVKNARIVPILVFCLPEEYFAFILSVSINKAGFKIALRNGL